jgi:hypothetical protein
MGAGRIVGLAALDEVLDHGGLEVHIDAEWHYHHLPRPRVLSPQLVRPALQYRYASIATE